MQEVLIRSYALSDAFQHSARTFRNRLVLTTAIVVLGAGCLVLLQWRLPGAAIFVLPKGTEHLPRWCVLLLVLLFGSLGALLTAIPAMASLPRIDSAYNFPLQESFVKIAVGSISAVAGVLLIGNTGVSEGFPSLQALLGIATVFGAGQQAITRYLDKRAIDLAALGDQVA